MANTINGLGSTLLSQLQQTNANQKPAQPAAPTKKAAPAQDTVQISNAAKAALASHSDADHDGD